MRHPVLPTHQAYTANRGIGKERPDAGIPKSDHRPPFKLYFIVFLFLQSFSNKSNPLLRIALHFAYLFFALDCRLHPRLTTEDDRFGNRIAADSVVAVQTAANFAACEQSGNDVAALIQNVRLLIDVKTAHRVVNGRCNMNRIVGSLIQFAFHARLSAEFRVLFLFDGLIPLFNRLLQIIFLDVKFLASSSKVLASTTRPCF